MFLHVRLAKEVFSTVAARVRLMIRVNQFMRWKTRRPLKFFATFQAFIDFCFWGDRVVRCSFIAIFSLSSLKVVETRGYPIARRASSGNERFWWVRSRNKRRLMNYMVEVHPGWVSSKVWASEGVCNTPIPRNGPKHKRRRWRHGERNLRKAKLQLRVKQFRARTSNKGGKSDMLAFLCVRSVSEYRIVNKRRLCSVGWCRRSRWFVCTWILRFIFWGKEDNNTA